MIIEIKKQKTQKIVPQKKIKCKDYKNCLKAANLKIK